LSTDIRCAAYLGVSMDGFIAGPDGDLSWLEGTPNPTGSDLGYGSFMESIDAIVMGRNTFETVVAFEGDWPYTKPIIVLSSSLQQVPDKAVHAELSTSAPTELIEELAARGMTKLYIDGGSVVTSFLQEGLLDELTATTLPVVLGAGIPLFGPLDEAVWFDHISTEVLLGALVQTTYHRRL
jgi:dihydrofolate reductase